VFFISQDRFLRYYCGLNLAKKTVKFVFFLNPTTEDLITKMISKFVNFYKKIPSSKYEPKNSKRITWSFFINSLIFFFLISTRVFAQEAVINGDHEFDTGSKITIESLTTQQLQNMTTLGKVWGFLKYHHPLITSGQRHWDYDLFRVIPTMLAAPDRSSANLILLNWIASLGEVADCNPCASLLSRDLYLRPSLEWINNIDQLGLGLSTVLQNIYRNRQASGDQFYVQLAPDVENPVFLHELSYKSISFPDAGFQILALFRFWNIIEYWAPYRDRIDENWNNVLYESLTKLSLAKDKTSYKLEMIALIARITDTHANLWSSLSVRPPVGNCQLPIRIRFIENRSVVTGYLTGESAETTNLMIGDVIETLSDVSIPELIQNLTPYYAASNGPTRLRDIARNISRGACGETNLLVRNENGGREVNSKRVSIEKSEPDDTHDRVGDTFQRLSKDVAYIKLSSIKSVDIARYIASAKGTKGLIIDIRNYPSDFVVFSLGQHLVKKATEITRSTIGDLGNPGAFHWTPSDILQPQKPYYPGKVVILVDEVSQSQAEYTAMALRAAPNARVIGSTTAGADGDFSSIPLPGKVYSGISGIGIFYPDKRPTQKVGITPDIKVTPTIAGIRAGRDEVLEAAITEITGKRTK
jgi:C-terminal processing protease CtpA/Prc